MPFSRDTTDRIQAALREVLASASLNDWQRAFLADMQARFDKYGPRTRLSDKQYAKLRQVLAPFEGEEVSSGKTERPPRPKPSSAKSRTRMRSPSRRRARSPFGLVRKARRDLRSAIWIAAAIVAVVGVIGGLFDAGGPGKPEGPAPMSPDTTTTVRHVDAATAQPDRRNTISGRVSHVRDGDTIEVAGVAIRFQKLDCAESGTAAGERATRAMRALVAGEELTCRLAGRRSYDREIGTCALPDGRDIGRYMILEGYCGRYR